MISFANDRIKSIETAEFAGDRLVIIIQMDPEVWSEVCFPQMKNKEPLEVRPLADEL